MTRCTNRLPVLLAGIFLAAGCGGDSGRDQRVPISGKVTYAGEPVTEGRIMFYPEDGRRMAMGAIDAAGHYELTTYDRGDGAFLGTHKVVIDAVRENSAGPASPAEELQAEDPGFVRLVPSVYADRKSTPLTAEISEADDAMDFELPRRQD